MDANIVHSFFLIFAGAAVAASIALYSKQPLIIAYIALGALLGPYGFKLISHPELLEGMSHVGIIFLLFLLGLDMQPSHLLSMLKKASWVAVISSFAFAGLGYFITLSFGYSSSEAIVVGLAMMFSSTIVCIKLLPTTVLHHRHTGELVVGLLLLQDIIAIAVLLGLVAYATPNFCSGWPSVQQRCSNLEPHLFLELPKPKWWRSAIWRPSGRNH